MAITLADIETQLHNLSGLGGCNLDSSSSATSYTSAEQLQQLCWNNAVSMSLKRELSDEEVPASVPELTSYDQSGCTALKPVVTSAMASDAGSSSTHSPTAFSPSSSQGNDLKNQICFDFTKGVCTRGDKCKYSHDIATIVSVNSKEKGICFDYLRNQCNRGLLCRFSHDLSNIANQCQITTATGMKSRTTAICYDFVKGVCQRGAQCRYSHDLSMIARTARNNGSRTTEMCYDYLRGRCARGATCKYSHNIFLAAAPGMLPMQASAMNLMSNPAGLPFAALQGSSLMPQLQGHQLGPYSSVNPVAASAAAAGIAAAAAAASRIPAVNSRMSLGGISSMGAGAPQYLQQLSSSGLMNMNMSMNMANGHSLDHLSAAQDPLWAAMAQQNALSAAVNDVPTSVNHPLLGSQQGQLLPSTMGLTSDANALSTSLRLVQGMSRPDIIPSSLPLVEQVNSYSSLNSLYMNGSANNSGLSGADSLLSNLGLRSTTNAAAAAAMLTSASKVAEYASAPQPFKHQPLQMLALNAEETRPKLALSSHAAPLSMSEISSGWSWSDLGATL